MSWGKLDDRMHSNERMIALSHPAFRLYWVVVSYVRERKTAGVISRTGAEALARTHRCPLPSTIQELVKEGRWEPDPDGVSYHIHDWHVFYPPELADVRRSNGRLGGRPPKPRQEPNGNHHGFQPETSKVIAQKPSGVPRAGGNPSPISPDTDTPTPTPPIGVPPSLVTSGGSDRRESVQRVWEAWLESTGKRRSVFDPKRRRLIEARLQDYSTDELVEAVQGWKASPYHRGENERGEVYNGLGLLLRDSEHVEKFIAFHRGEKTNGSGPKVPIHPVDRQLQEIRNRMTTTPPGPTGAMLRLPAASRSGPQ